MKYKFIVDENIFYCAIRGVDEYDNNDNSSARFLALLLKNCHKMHLDKEYNRRYKKNIQKKLESIPLDEYIFPGIDKLIQEIVHNSDKTIRDFSDALEIPGEDGIPRKDIYIARCANQFSAKIVTLDREFREAVNVHVFLKQNGIEALHPKDAINYVSET
jgi:predicted nucleic acid-binding protein